MLVSDSHFLKENNLLVVIHKIIYKVLEERKLKSTSSNPLPILIQETGTGEQKAMFFFLFNCSMGEVLAM